MATRTINSPGVEVFEIDLSLYSQRTGGVETFLTGFADKGPTDEIISVGSLTELEDVFGFPTNSAERYFHHTARQVLLRPGSNLWVTRLPYGANEGDGYTNKYSATVYPVSANNTDWDLATEYSILSPVSMLLTDDEYNDISQNNITWSQTCIPSAISASNINTVSAIGLRAGIIIVNEAKTTVNSLNEGFYLSLTDNSSHNPSSAFDAVTGVKAASGRANGNVTQTYATVPPGRLSFKPSKENLESGQCVSEFIEKYPAGYDFGSDTFKDSININIFKIRNSIYAKDTNILDFIPVEVHTGSLNAQRTINNPNGSTTNSFFIGNVLNSKSNNFKIAINPYITNLGSWVGTDGLPTKRVRVTQGAKNLYSQGVYMSDADRASKDIGNVPLKLERVLRRIDDYDFNLDLVLEAGLGTIWTGGKAKFADFVTANNIDPDNYDDYSMDYDENYPIDISSIKSSTGEVNQLLDGPYLYYRDIVNAFVSFATDTRKDHLFVADPLRHIFVQGPNSRVSKRKDYVFSTDIYWPIKNLFAGAISSYACSYANWIKTTDVASGTQVWVPASGWAAAVMAYSQQVSFPWTAPAGFNRGTLTNVIDLAINPLQKHRDLLYKINQNPIAYFPGDGFVVWGQKTLLNRPSAFDRINVRRLFLYLEKITKNTLKYFVFEPNSLSTRTRLVDTIAPLFDNALNNDGVYDYKIVCDERNNTPDVIDNNEMKVSIYLQPVKTAEFILVDFIATRTGVDFDELIAAGIF